MFISAVVIVAFFMRKHSLLFVTVFSKEEEEVNRNTSKLQKGNPFCILDLAMWEFRFHIYDDRLDLIVRFDKKRGTSKSNKTFIFFFLEY